MKSTHTVRLVLTALLANGGEMTGYDIVKATGLQSGTVYPIVRRLAANELVTARESLERSRLRIYYRLTDKGRHVAQDAAASAVPAHRVRRIRLPRRFKPTTARRER